MEEKLKRLYENALKYFDLPAYEQFAIDMQDPVKMGKLRENMLEHYEMPPIEQMLQDFGVKKKDSPSISPQNVSVSTTETQVAEDGSLESLATDEVINQGEENAVPELNYLFGNKGFKFEESIPGINAIKITSPTGVEETFTNYKRNPKGIQDFIKNNQSTDPLSTIEKNFDKNEVKFYDEEEYDNYVKSFQNNQSRFNSELKLYLRDFNELEKERQYFYSKEYNDLKQSNPLLAQQQLAQFKEKDLQIEDRRNKISKKQQTNQKDMIAYRKNAGRYVEKEAEKGTFVGAFINKFFDGVSRIASGQSGIATDILVNILPNAGMAPEDYNRNIIEELINSGEKVEGLDSKDLDYDSWRVSLTDEKVEEIQGFKKGRPAEMALRNAYLEAKYEDIPLDKLQNIVNNIDKSKKSELNSKVKDIASKSVKAEVLPSVRVGATDLLSRPITKTTREYADRVQRESLVGGAVLGVGESLPALMGYGFGGRILNFGILQMDAINEEMEKDPSFAEVPESQKYLITGPLGIVTGILEAYGFRNMTASSPFVKQLTLQGLKKLGQGTGRSSAKTFSEIIEREVKNKILKGTLRVGSAGLAEAETGALQQIAEINAKRLWNVASDKGNFDTPEAFSEEYYKQILKAGIQEGIGGITLSIPMMMYQGLGTDPMVNNLEEMTDELFELFLNTSNDKNYKKIRKGQVGAIKEMINDGKLTKKEGEKILANYDQIVGLSKKINPELDTQSKKEILSLMVEEQALMQKKANKDPRTVKDIDNRIEEINKSITKITEDAIQKPSTEKVDVQEQSIDGPKVGKGDTEGTITKEGKEETEVVVEEETKSEEEVDPLAINNKDSVKRETYTFTRERIEGEPDENFTIQVTTAKDGSRTFRYRTLEGQVYNTITVSENNTLTNEEFIENSEIVEPGTIKLTETVKGFENIANPKSVARRKKQIAEEKTKKPLPGKVANNLKQLYDIQRKVFNLDRDQALGAATVMDKAIRSMAKREGISVEEMYKKIKFVKATDEDIKGLKKQKKLYQAPKSPIGKLAQLYNFNEFGYSMASNLDEFALRKAAEKLGYGIKKARSGKYYFTKNGGMINPFIETGGPLFQEMDGSARGAMIARDGEFVIIAMTNPDVSTPLHELAHVYEKYLTKEEKQTVLKFAGKKRWSREVSEIFARGFEKYLADGKAPNSRLERIFSRFKDWLTDIYNGIKGSAIEKKLTPNMVKVYDAMLGKGVKTKGFDMKKTSELTKLKEIVKSEKRGAKEAVRDFRKKAAEVVKYIKGLGNKNVITKNQANVMISKALRTNFNDEAQVKALQDYITKIYEKADLANTIVQANKKRKVAKRNIKSKIGSAKDLFPSLQKLLSYDAKIIPLDKLDAYMDLLNIIGERAKVLTLDESGKMLKTADDIINSVIVKEETNLEESTQLELDFNLDNEINDILNIKLDTSPLKGQLAFEDGEFFKTLTKEDLKQLVKEKKDGSNDYSTLVNLKKILNNINNGFIDQSAVSLMDDIIANRNKFTNIIKSKVKGTNITNFLSKFYGKVKSVLRGGSGTFQEIRATNMGNIDEVLGNYNNSDIAKATALILASEYSKAETDIGIADKLLEEAEVLLSKPNSKIQLVKGTNSIVESKYRLMIYALQREYNANPDKKGVEPAIDYVDKTIEMLEKSNKTFAQEDIKILKKLKKEFSNKEGQIDNEKLNKALSKNEIKALELIDKVNESLAAKALYTAANVRGNRVDLYNYYVHHDVVYESKEDMSKATLEQQQKFMNPTGSTKAGTLTQRTPGGKPINFDIISSTSRGMRQTIMDYQMTRPIRQVLKTVDKVQKEIDNDPNATDIQKESVDALKKALEENIRIVFEGNFIETTFGERIFDNMRRIGYFAALASVPRAGAELGSNLLFGLLSSPKALIQGMTKFGKYAMNPKSAMFLRNIGSSETLKLYDPTALTGKMVDAAVFKKGKSVKDRAIPPILEKINFIYDNLPIIKGLGAATDFIASNLISTPDKAISRPLYFAEFVNAFEKETGVKLTEQDLVNIGEGKSEYLKNKEAIKNARVAADAAIVRMATSVNPFNSILKLQTQKQDSGMMRAYKLANGYMARFNLFEFITAKKAITAMYNNGDLSRVQAGGLLLGITGRMTAYMALYTVLRGLFDEAFDMEDEEEDIVLEDLLGRQLVGTIATLMFRRGLGNIPNYPISLAIELANEKFGEDLRGGEEYDQFEHSVVFNLIGAEDIKNKTAFENAIKLFAGPYGPALQSSERLRKVLVGLTTAKDKKTRDFYERELTERMAVELAGNLNLLPFYKDIRRMIVNDFFADKRKAQKKSGGRISYSKEELENLRKYAPAAYRQIIKMLKEQEKREKKN